MHVDSVGAGIAVAIGITVVNTLATSLLAIDDDDFYYRNVAQAPGAPPRGAGGRHRRARRLLPRDRRARPRRGPARDPRRAPPDARALDPRRQRTGCFGGRPTGPRRPARARRGCCTATNDDMPAFRWWEKDRGQGDRHQPPEGRRRDRAAPLRRARACCTRTARAGRTSSPATPPHTLLTMSTVLDRDRPGPHRPGLLRLLREPLQRHPHDHAVIGDIAQELYFAAQQRRRDIRPRIKRSFSYALVRAWGTVIQRDLQVAAVIGDLYAGRPVGYTTFLAYDEVAHHSGVERADALATLRRVDRQIARIAAAAADARAPVSPGRALRPWPVAGRDLPGPLRRDPRGPRLRCVQCRVGGGPGRPQRRVAQLPRGRPHRGGWLGGHARPRESER